MPAHGPCDIYAVMTFEKMPGGSYHLEGRRYRPGPRAHRRALRGHAPSRRQCVRGCTLTFEVPDADATYARALAEGGAEAMTDFPGIGRCAYMEDGEGNIFGVIRLPGREDAEESMTAKINIRRSTTEVCATGENS